MRWIRVISVGAMVATLAAGGVASAAPGVKHLPARANVVPFAKPKGYTIVVGSTVSVGAGSQAFGAVLCPTGKKVFGGGVFSSSGSVLVNLNGSYPYADGSGWKGYDNNASASTATFFVYAVCAKKPKGYKIVDAVTSVPAISQATSSVVCPPKTKALGGGGLMASASTASNINSSIPFAGGWRADGNNGGSAADTLTVWAVCGKGVTGLSDVTGTTVSNPAGTQTRASVACPTGAVPVGGGGFSGSGSTSVNMNTSVPSGSSWLVDENNASATTTSIIAYVVCAK